MSTGPRLDLRQSQSLVMTAQLQQSIKLLQLSAMELNEFVAEEMEQNPLLAADDGAGEEAVAEPASEDSATDTQDLVDLAENRVNETTEEGMLDAPREAFWDDAEGGVYTPSAQGQQTELRAPVVGDGREFEQNVSEAPSLQDHLLSQLHIVISDPIQRLIGLHIIDLVDERGYVPEDLSAVEESLQCEAQDVEEALQALQQFDPPGVFARNLAECLAIQLREQDRFDPTMEKLLQHLDMIPMGEDKRLAKLCGVEEEDLPFMFEEIRALNPKPGYRFGSEIVQAVIPDVFLRKRNDGGWQVELNSDALPKVLVNNSYYTQISASARRKEDKKYLSDQLAHANWLIKAMDQRAQSILKVATEIVRQQDAFFRFGVRHFKPLTLRDIADAVEVHESTVSRVTTQKYISTGTAVYELKYFFSSSVGSNDSGDAHSSEAVKDHIKEMIDGESPKAILSDDAIADALQQKGIDIARRTVAKYREAMGIPSSPTRRREKKHLT